MSQEHSERVKPLLPLSRTPTAAVAWLWPGRLALTKLAILEGDPGMGKSLVALDLCARVTRGGLFPDGSDVLVVYPSRHASSLGRISLGVRIPLPSGRSEAGVPSPRGRVERRHLLTPCSSHRKRGCGMYSATALQEASNDCERSRAPECRLL